MNNIISFLAVIMGFCMNAVYKICKNYGISLIVFTIVSKRRVHECSNRIVR